MSGCGTDAAALQSLAKELGPDHHLQPCDVTDPAAVTERFGVPDLLLNNATTINPLKPLWEVSADEFGRVIDVNLKGVHLVIRSFLPGMIRRGKGREWWRAFPPAGAAAHHRKSPHTAPPSGASRD